MVKPSPRRTASKLSKRMSKRPNQNSGTSRAIASKRARIASVTSPVPSRKIAPRLWLPANASRNGAPRASTSPRRAAWRPR